MPSQFRMQILDTLSGELVEFEPGKSIEMSFISDIIDNLLKKRIGFFTTKKKVRDAVISSVREAIFDLKKKVRP